MYKHRPHRLQPPRSSSYIPDRLPLWLSCPLLPTRPPPATYQMSWPWASWARLAGSSAQARPYAPTGQTVRPPPPPTPCSKPGACYVYHDAIFDAITNEDVCPFVNPN